MQCVREQLIQSAIAEVHEGASQKDAAARYSLPRSTLSDRIRGAASKKEAKIPRQRLSPEQESFIADWCLNEERAGRAPSRRQVVTFAQEILAEGGDYQPLGSRWIDRFLRRNTDVQTKISSSLESSRTRGSNREAYEDFYCRLHTQIEEKDIKPANITNMDEHGMQELDTEAGKVIGTSLTSRAYVTSSDATAWVSIIEAGTAEGRRLSPVLIFTGASLQGQWFPPGFRLEAEFPDWRYDFSPTGWSNAEIALKWLREVYLVEAKPRSPSEWRLLVLDEHSSHISVKFMLLAHRNKVQLLYLPAHTSHKTQPLDRSVFSALKTYFRQNAKALAGFTASAAINKQRFSSAIEMPRHAAWHLETLSAALELLVSGRTTPPRCWMTPRRSLKMESPLHCHLHHRKLPLTRQAVPLRLLRRAKMFARLKRRLESKLVQPIGLLGPCLTRLGGR